MFRSLFMIVVSTFILFANSSAIDSVDVVGGASPQVTKDSTYSYSYIDYYCAFVDSLYNVGFLYEEKVPHKTNVGAMAVYLLEDIPLLLTGNVGGDEKEIFISVYLENKTLRKIIQTERIFDYTSYYKKYGKKKAVKRHLLPYSEVETILSLGNKITYEVFSEGILISSKENIETKKMLIESAEKMLRSMNKTL